MKVKEVTFEVEHEGQPLTAVFHPMKARQWRVTLIARDRREVFEPEKGVSCWPCATHAMALLNRWLSPGPTIQEWAAEQSAEVWGDDEDDEPPEGWDFTGPEEQPEDDDADGEILKMSDRWNDKDKL